MHTISLTTAQLKTEAAGLRAGDRVLLSGTVYTARDAAHKRLAALLDAGEALPFELEGAAVYYCGTTPAPDVVGACGPTTSGRMDVYAPRLYDLGLAATIGKGERSPSVADAIVRNRAVYLCAIGGAGALAAEHVTSCEVIAFGDLGCEAVKRMELRDFPLTVAIDCAGGDIFDRPAAARF